MTDGATDLPSIRLKPGEMLIRREPCLVTTVLGSCLAVTLYNARLQIAAICHAMLPSPANHQPSANAPAERFKYVSHAIPAMAEAFRRAGLKPGEIEVKMFGGGNVIGPEERRRSEVEGVGPANIRLARVLLEQERLRVRASNVGGRHGRKIVFNTATGEVLHKHLD